MIADDGPLTPRDHKLADSGIAISENRVLQREPRNWRLQQRIVITMRSTMTLMNRTLIAIGVLLVIVGLAWKPLSTLPFFRLPGDFVIDRPGFKFFFPLTTMLIVSGVVSLIVWLFRR